MDIFSSQYKNQGHRRHKFSHTSTFPFPTCLVCNIMTLDKVSWTIHYMTKKKNLFKVNFHMLSEQQHHIPLELFHRSKNEAIRVQKPKVKDITVAKTAFGSALPDFVKHMCWLHGSCSILLVMSVLPMGQHKVGNCSIEVPVFSC